MQVLEVFNSLPGATQACLYSSSLGQRTLELTEGFMRDPVRIVVSEEDLAPHESVRHYSVVSAGDDEAKIEALVRICEETEEP